MKVRDFISEDKEYAAAEKEIREWVEKSYPGLSIDFEPHIEIVQVNPVVVYPPERVEKIVEAVNIKIGDILESRAERIYIAERLERIYKNHPRFNIDVESIDDIKKNKLFLKYLKELIV
jgi:hypothetical protein